jgi:hypothetical protein
MSLYLEFDNGAQRDLASNKGWSEFGDWADKLSLAAYGAVIELWEHGITERVERLGEQLAVAVKKENPSKDVSSIAQNILDAVAEIKDAEFVMVTNGITPDSGDVQRKKGEGADSLDEDGIDSLVGSIDQPQPVVNHSNGKELGILTAATIRAFWDAEVDEEKQPSGTTHEPVAPFTWHPPSLQYVDSNRRAASRESVKAACEALDGAAHRDILQAANKFKNGNMSIDELDAVMQRGISHIVGANGVLATHDMPNGSRAWQWADRVATEQLNYWQTRRQAIVDGEYGDAAPYADLLLTHIGQYPNLGRKVYEGARMYDAAEKLNHTVAINILGGNERHCDECPVLTAQGETPIEKMPVPGDRECNGGCNCAVVTGMPGTLGRLWASAKAAARELLERWERAVTTE